MKLETYVRKKSESFSNQKIALIRLDSIAFLASERSLSEIKIKNHLKKVCEIALSYNTQEMQVEALKILEKVYGAGLNDPQTALSKYVDGYGEEDPVEKLYFRLQGYLEEKKQMPNIKSLELIAEDGLHGFGIHRPPPSGTGLIYPQRVKKSHTDS